VVLVVAQVPILFWSTRLWVQLQHMVAVVAVCTLIQTIQALVADQAAAGVLMVPLHMAGQHLHLARAMLAVLVLAINLGMLEFLVAVVAQVL
jgi:hypothetical protein